MDEEIEQTEGGVVKAISAYHYYSRDKSAKIKDELLKEGKDTSLGAIVAIVSKQWREATNEEREPYEKLATVDRLRYLHDCEIRDQEVLRQQEERRAANNATETETRFREKTLVNSESSMIKADKPKRTREWTQEELDEREERRVAKQTEINSISNQHEELKKSRVDQAEARLKYLLNQSDIFSHFGVGGKKPTKADDVPKQKDDCSKSKHRSSKSKKDDFDDLDDDEREIVAEEDEDNENGSKIKNTILLKQPSIVSGGDMRAYQLEGLNWMIKLQENGINGILADEMGLGKTLQSISILAYMKEFVGVSGPHLVMVPKSTLSNWMNEFKRWCPSIRTLKFHGSKEERADIMNNQLRASASHDQRDWDVCITTYEVVNLEKTSLAKFAWRYLVIDEAHRLKNEASQFSMTVRLLNTQYRLLLTGTPLQNNLHELWALLNFLLPDVFASAEQFDEWFNLDVDDTEAKQRIISQLHKILRPFMLRRLKADVEKSLPPKTETILFTGMSAIQRQTYTSILLRDIDTVNGSGANGSRTAILNIVMQLRKCCNHPYLFPGIEDRSMDPLGDHLYTSCGKMVLLDKLLMKMKERGHRVLIFSQMTRMLDILEDYLISKGYLYCRIDGNTSYDEREDRIADYNKPDSDKFIFLLSTRAGGLGINLQTADTVILYDSDWNPQADLQAQDRAHRIGQKKVVQVFRLITDDSVEVKVVERAQQKLKLDAMVVQQGRLQDKEKKLSKQDLLETIKFGADKVFRSKESTITDDDIDLILAEGKKRTEAMTEKLQLAEKGDLYNFSLDSGLSTQVFEGKDYSDKTFRENELLAMSFIDIGKRERKVVASYSEVATRAANDDGEKRPKIPRHLKLPKMEDWQFYDKEKLQDLHNEELRLFEEVVDRGEAPQVGSINRFIVLPPEKHQEKQRLLNDAFGTWSRQDFNNFVKSTAKNGRLAYEKIAKDVRRPVDEIKRYGEMFWTKGPNVFPPAEWDRHVKQIEKGEKKLEEIQRLTSATKKLIMMFSDPWEQLTFRHVGNQGRIYNSMEDRYLLCLTHIHGYGNWDLVRSSMRRCDRFRFDFYIQACTAEALGKRCELLMRAAEREVNEIEKKKQAIEALAVSNSRPKDLVDVNKVKLESLIREIRAESQRLSLARSQLQSLKSTSKSMTEDTKANQGTKDVSAMSSGNFKKGQILSKSSLGEVTESKNPKFGGPRAIPIPNNMLPELCRMIKEAGPDGVSKVVEKFVDKYPNYAKRQVELKISEIAIKEKRVNDSKLVWYILPQYEHYLEMENFEENPEKCVEGGSSKKRKMSSENTQQDAIIHSTTPDLKPKKLKTSASSEGDKMQPTSASQMEPKKYKRAFAWFVKDKRPEAEKVAKNPEDNAELKDLLSEMWDKLSSDDRLIYQKKEQDDRLRYENELKFFETSS